MADIKRYREHVDELPEDFSSELGLQSQVLATITAILPDLDLTDPRWGILRNKDFSIEFNYNCVTCI